MAWLKGIRQNDGQILVTEDIEFSGEIDFTGSALQTVRTTITSGAIKTLSATPVALVAAPGSGKWLEFVSAQLLLDYGSNVLAEPSAPDDMQIIYDTVTTAVVSQDIDATGFITATADTRTNALPKVNAIIASASVVNKGLYIWNSGGNYTGNTANDSVLYIDVNYRIHEV